MAAKFYRAAATRNHAHAQTMLAELYAFGQGVTHDDVEALMWCRKAAEQGYPLAQTALGFAYAQGKGAPQDFVEALMWSNLAQAQNDFMAAMFREHLVFRMSDEQIAEAERLTREWQPVL